VKRMVALVIACIMLCSCTRNANIDIANTEGEKTQVVKNVKSTFYIDGELPDIGSFSGVEQYERFYEEYTPDFIPSDKYGKIMPYIGNIKVYKTPSQSGDESGFEASSTYASYGFCTLDGKIVMDARSDINYVSRGTTEDGFSYYQFSFSPKSDGKEVYDDVFMPQRSMVIPESGEWCLELERGSWLSDAGCGYLSISYVSENNKEDYPAPDSVRIYDYNGNFVCEFDGNENAEICGDGLFLLRDYSNDVSVSKFVDINGETVFGPFEWASSFNEYGIASVKDYDGNSFLMDLQGNRLTDDEYSNINTIYGYDSEQGFQAVYKNNKRKFDIFALDGSLLGTVNSGSNYNSVSVCHDNTIIYNYHNNDRQVYRRIDGTPFISKELGVEPNQYAGVDGLFVYLDNENMNAVVFDHNGETVFKLDELEYLEGVSSDRKFAVYSTGNVEYVYDEITEVNTVVNTSKQHIYDIENNEILLTCDGVGYFEFCGNNDRYVIMRIDTTDGFFSSVYNYGLYDTVDKKVLFDNCLSIECLNIDGEDYFNVCKENKCTIYDSNFKVLLKTINE